MSSNRALADPERMLDQIKVVRPDGPHTLTPLRLFPFLFAPARCGPNPPSDDLHDRLVPPLARLHAADDEQLPMLPRAPHERGRPRDAQALELGEDGVEERGRGRRGARVVLRELQDEVVDVLEGLIRALAEVLSQRELVGFCQEEEGTHWAGGVRGVS